MNMFKFNHIDMEKEDISEEQCVKICKYIAYEVHKKLECSMHRCKFVYDQDKYIGIIVYNKSCTEENAIRSYRKTMFKTTHDFFYATRHFYKVNRSWVSFYGKLFILPIEQLMLLADLHEVE